MGILSKASVLLSYSLVTADIQCVKIKYCLFARHKDSNKSEQQQQQQKQERKRPMVNLTLI